MKSIYLIIVGSFVITSCVDYETEEIIENRKKNNLRLTYLLLRKYRMIVLNI